MTLTGHKRKRYNRYTPPKVFASVEDTIIKIPSASYLPRSSRQLRIMYLSPSASILAFAIVKLLLYFAPLLAFLTS